MKVRFTRSAIDTECAAGCDKPIQAGKPCIVMDSVIVAMLQDEDGLNPLKSGLTFCVLCFTEAVESLEVQCLAQKE